jgi:hypothetical protein
MKIIITGIMGVCCHCKDPFLTKRKDRKYCSNACKQKAWIQRKYTVKKEFGVPKKEGFLKRFFNAFR